MTIDVIPLDEHRARDLTERIRRATENLWSLLAEAHDGRAWAALGYDSFKAYVETEFGMSRRHAYYLLDQAEVIKAVTEASGVQDLAHIPVTIEEAKDLKPHLDLVVENVRDATVDTEPDMKAEATRAAIEKTREFIRQREPQPLNKTDLGGGVVHPARFTAGLIPVFAEFLDPGWKVLDPFAGTGKIHELRDHVAVETVGIELEPEWANLHPDTRVGNALDLPFGDESFDAIVTSPTYGNRLADNHDAYDPEARRTYRVDLGRPLTAGNSGALQWGPRYRTLHRDAWEEALRVLRPGGTFVLNIKDHIRAGARQPVSAWHACTLIELGCTLIDCVPFTVTGHRNGSNHLARLDAELVWAFTKKTGT